MIELERQASRAIIATSKTYCFLNQENVIKVRMRRVCDSDKWMNPVTNTIKHIASNYIEFFEHFMQTGEATVYTWLFRTELEQRNAENI